MTMPGHPGWTTRFGLAAALAILPAGMALAFNEAPALKTRVDAGQLPPVAARLPAAPLVLKPLAAIGSYGGDLRTDLLGGTDRGYGWLNRIIGYEPLVRFAPEGGRVVPGVAESWTASPDSREFTFTLRAGMKWSDGAPVTADDVLFWYQDMALNRQLFPGGPGSNLVVAGKPAEVTKIDDRTVKFSFAAPYGLFLQQLASGNNQPPLAPKHYAHPVPPQIQRGRPAGADQGGRASPPGSTCSCRRSVARSATISPPGSTRRCRCCTPGWSSGPYDGSSSQVVAVRNPYYWKVDSAGNQLPYIDRVVFPIIGDPEVLKLMVMNGQVDFVYRPQKFRHRRQAGPVREPPGRQIPLHRPLRRRLGGARAAPQSHRAGSGSSGRCSTPRISASRCRRPSTAPS